MIRRKLPYVGFTRIFTNLPNLEAMKKEKQALDMKKRMNYKKEENKGSRKS